MCLQKMGCVDALWDMLDGIFACVIVDERSGEFFAARDAIGVCPLYWGRAADGGFWFSSELKGLQAQCESFDIFPPVRGLALWTAWHVYQELRKCVPALRPEKLLECA